MDKVPCKLTYDEIAAFFHNANEEGDSAAQAENKVGEGADGTNDVVLEGFTKKTRRSFSSSSGIVCIAFGNCEKIFADSNLNSQTLLVLKLWPPNVRLSKKQPSAV
jgi:hypothetical protein